MTTRTLPKGKRVWWTLAEERKARALARRHRCQIIPHGDSAGRYALVSATRLAPYKVGGIDQIVAWMVRQDWR